MRVLVTGNAGFIGFHVAKLLLSRGNSVIGVDVVNDYYSTELKEARLALLQAHAKQCAASYQFRRIDLADTVELGKCFAEEGPFERVIHLAAQAGVRYSIENPAAYVRSNLIAFANILESCRRGGVGHLTYASTSSVYGANTKLPFVENDGANHPLQFYAATKRANELMAHSYSHLYKLPTSGLRFFTVYGPWGRPDMALFLFTKKILAGQPIQLFNNGEHVRDFTYIDDIAEGVVRVNDKIAIADPYWNSDAPSSATSNAPFRLLNIGNNAPVHLADYVAAIEEAVGKTAVRELMPLQPGDVPNTYADVSLLEKETGFVPRTSVRVGIERFVRWYRDYFGV